MDWAFPIYNLSLAAVWFLLVQTSFALMIWALEVDSTWLKAFIASGSALSTLGFATPSNPVGQLLGVLEGAVGLGIVVFILGFIPGYRSAVEVRENLVGWLYARVGARPTAFSLVEWCQTADQSEDMTPIWNAGESGSAASRRHTRALLCSHSFHPPIRAGRGSAPPPSYSMPPHSRYPRKKLKDLSQPARVTR